MLRISRPLESPDSSGEDHADELRDSSQREGSNPPHPVFEDDALKCPICFEVFTVPKMLVCCGRSICQECEQGILTARSYGNCPVCSSPRSISGTPLPVNISLRNAMELFRSSGQGMTCLCEECEKQVKVNEVYCCATCDKKKKICSHCALKKHKGHDIEEIGYVNKETREQMVKEVEFLTKPYTTLPAVNTVCNAVRSDFERVLRLTDNNLQKAKNMCSDIVCNNYMTEDMIRTRIDEAKKINKQVAQDYEAINKIKDNLHELQDELSVDILARIEM
uniref:RING-type domain-containing protein n=1 Tax=Steinernema glaseri TaxID=37863 RepID=A0A1I7YJJ0_9BILA